LVSTVQREVAKTVDFVRINTPRGCASNKGKLVKGYKFEVGQMMLWDFCLKKNHVYLWKSSESK
jgi:hypothetical protein